MVGWLVGWLTGWLVGWFVVCLVVLCLATASIRGNKALLACLIADGPSHEVALGEKIAILAREISLSQVPESTP